MFQLTEQTNPENFWPEYMINPKPHKTLNHRPNWCLNKTNQISKQNFNSSSNKSLVQQNYLISSKQHFGLWNISNQNKITHLSLMKISNVTNKLNNTFTCVKTNHKQPENPKKESNWTQIKYQPQNHNSYHNQNTRIRNEPNQLKLRWINAKVNL